jgi:hypothetical protein
MKTILHIDSSIKSTDLCEARLLQIMNGLNSIFKHIDFFKLNNTDIVYVDNTISNINELPMIRDIIPKEVKCIFKENNIYGKISKTCGCFEHWKLIENILDDYDYIIHFEARQTLLDLSFFENFFKEPITIFSWAHKKVYFPLGNFKNKDNRFKINLYGRDNSNYKDVYFNDFYTGLFSFSVDKFKEFTKKADLKKIIIPPRASLEKLTMNFAYDNLESFKIINRLGILRYNTYDSLMYPTYY